ncbi:MAG: sulfite exporter TauE/SafE family protein [bacterium]
MGRREVQLDSLLYIIAGASVGLAIGVTGVGGGSLMTPLLLAFGFPLHVAVGTDLLYAAITKSGGVVGHTIHRSIRWDLVLLLAIGSIPASALSVYALKYWFQTPENYAGIISAALGLTLILTSVAIIFRSRLSNLAGKLTIVNDANLVWLTPIMGLVLGVLVTLSSVGAGAIVTALLMIFYPALKSIQVVGTDIAHAVPLTLFAGLGHLFIGNVDLKLLVLLLAGSLPAVYFGARLSKYIPESVMRPILATMLFGAGIKVAFS